MTAATARPRPPRAARDRAGAREPAKTLPVARVLVDVPLAHLDRPYDYLVSEPDSAAAVPGSRVRVRFAGRLVNGFVIARLAESDHPGRLGFLDRVVSAEPVLTPEIAELARVVAERYAGSTADVLRLAVPPRHARSEAEIPDSPPPCVTSMARDVDGEPDDEPTGCGRAAGRRCRGSLRRRAGRRLAALSGRGGVSRRDRSRASGPRGVAGHARRGLAEAIGRSSRSGGGCRARGPADRAGRQGPGQAGRRARRRPGNGPTRHSVRRPRSGGTVPPVSGRQPGTATGGCRNKGGGFRAGCRPRSGGRLR